MQPVQGSLIWPVTKSRRDCQIVGVQVSAFEISISFEYALRGLVSRVRPNKQSLALITPETYLRVLGQNSNKLRRRKLI